MKQSLQLRLGQQLSLTPQLQQAIHLLQLSTVDLQQEIQTALETNPMLEMPDEREETIETKSLVSEMADAQEEPGSSSASTTSDQELDLNSVDIIPTELPVDSAWDDLYPQGTAVKGSVNEDVPFEQLQAEKNTLQDYLMWQMDLTPFTLTDRAIATAIMDSIDDEGYLQASLEDILASVAADEQLITLEDVVVVLHQIQSFDPPGIAARDLRECLLLQLNQLPRQTPWREQATVLVTDYFALLAAHNYRNLMQKLKLSHDDLTSVVKLIQSLDPRPGRKLAADDISYVIPDVIVRRESERWVVELNPDVAPKVRINQAYVSLVRRADMSADNQFLRANLQEARWFVKSLQSRNETLLKVAGCLVEQQRDFFEYGEEAMNPLILQDVAQMVGMHESTISRITTQKYMHTPLGVFELKYFFSSHIHTQDGGECSSTAVKAVMKKVIASEDSKHPHSDNKIASILREKGFHIARRTVAKYREMMAVPSSTDRKGLF